MKLLLRDYQEELRHAAAHAVGALKKRAILLQCSTGGGKTVLAASMLIGSEQKGNQAVFILPRRELVYQTEGTLKRYGILPGVIMAGEKPNWHRRIQLASFDTLHARAMKRSSMKLPEGKVVIADEAHLSIADTRKAILDEYKARGALLFGLTATPARPDGKPMGDIYDHLVLGWPTARMMAEGYLVPARYVCPDAPDLAGVKLNEEGDYNTTQLGHVMDNPKLIGDIVSNWMLHAHGRRTVVFCVTKSHSRHTAEEFRKRGITAESVDDETSRDDRAAIFARVRSGATQVLCNVFIASYGLDIPVLDCAVIARPTKSLVLYLQIGGRVLRPVYLAGMPLDTVEQRFAAFLKHDALIIDHSGCVAEHGFLDDPIPWTLAGNESVSAAKKRMEAERKAPTEIICEKCRTAFKGSRHCPNCGHAMVEPGRPVPTREAILVEVERCMDGTRANKTLSWADKVRFLAEARGYARDKGFSEGWAANKYKAKFGVWPNDMRVKDTAPCAPGDIIKGWIKHEAIAARHRR